MLSFAVNREGNQFYLCFSPVLVERSENKVHIFDRNRVSSVVVELRCMLNIYVAYRFVCATNACITV